MSTPNYITARAMLDTAITWATGRPATQQAYMMLDDIAELHRPAEHPPSRLPGRPKDRPRQFCIHCKRDYPCPTMQVIHNQLTPRKQRRKFFGRKP